MMGIDNKYYFSNNVKNYKKIISSLLIIIFVLNGFTLLNFSVQVQAADPADKPVHSRAADTEPNNVFDNATLLMDDTVNGEVTDLDPVDYYKVILLKGQTVSIEFSTDLSGIQNLTLKLFDKDNNELWNSGMIGPAGKIFYNYTINLTPNSPYFIGIFASGVGNLYTLKTTISSQNDAGSGGDAPDNIGAAKEILSGTIEGFLAVMDVDDYYWFKINGGRVIDFNFSVKSDSDLVNFRIYNDSKVTTIKTIEKVAANEVRNFQYTTNNNGTRIFYIGVNIDYNARAEYSLTVDWRQQEDGLSYDDAGDNYSFSTPLVSETSYSGWLGGGNLGLDSIDVYNITVPIGNSTFYLNITPNPTLDIVIYVLDEQLNQLKSINPGLGEATKINYIFNTTEKSMIYIKLEIPKGQSSSGGYNLEFEFITKIPPNPDIDNDNMPTVWEEKYELNPNDASDANEDKDSDTFTNLQEFLANTDPTDPKSHPSTGEEYSHLTEAACIRSFNDPKKDVFQWYGTIDSKTNEIDISLSELTDKPNYDLIALDSSRKNENLIVKLKVSGKVEDLGSIDSLSKGSEFISGTYYEVVFVNKTFNELEINNKNLPQFINEGDSLIEMGLTYANKTYFGPLGTTGQLEDADQTISWLVPLKELAELPADFGLYAFVYHIELLSSNSTRTKSRALNNFRAYADSIGTGSLPQSGILKLVRNVKIEGRNVSVSLTTDQPGGILTVTPMTESLEEFIPDDLGSLGIFVDVTFISDDKPKNIFITVEYEEEDIPDDFKEENIKFYYYDIYSGKWSKVKESGVWKENNTAWARPEHLTVFAPMAGSVSDEPELTFLNLDFLCISVIIIIITVIMIIVIVALILFFKRKRKRPVAPPPSAPQQRALTPEFFSCPRCNEDIEVPYSDTESILLECSHCHAKGKIDNPYLLREREEGSGKGFDHERDYDRYPSETRTREHERGYDEYDYADLDRDERTRIYEQGYDEKTGVGEEVDLEYIPPGGGRRTVSVKPKTREERKMRERDSDSSSRDADKKTGYKKEPEMVSTSEDEDDYEYKACPKCGYQMPIPYVEDDRVLLKCPECGAKGKIKNPYI